MEFYSPSCSHSVCAPHTFVCCLKTWDFGETAFATIMTSATVVTTSARLLNSWHLSCQEYYSLLSSIWSELNPADIVRRTQSSSERFCWKQLVLKLPRKYEQYYWIKREERTTSGDGSWRFWVPCLYFAMNLAGVVLKTLQHQVSNVCCTPRLWSSVKPKHISCFQLNVQFTI